MISENIGSIHGTSESSTGEKGQIGEMNGRNHLTDLKFQAERILHDSECVFPESADVVR